MSKNNFNNEASNFAKACEGHMSVEELIEALPTTRIVNPNKLALKRPNRPNDTNHNTK